MGVLPSTQQHALDKKASQDTVRETAVLHTTEILSESESLPTAGQATTIAAEAVIAANSSPSGSGEVFQGANRHPLSEI